MIRSVENLPRRGAGVVRLVTAALALLSLAPVVDAQEGLAGTVRVEQATGGLTLNVNGKPMMVYGMNWDYFPIGTNYMYSLWTQPDDFIRDALANEMPLLQNMGVNAIRVYAGMPPRWVKYVYETYGIYTIINHPMARYGYTLDGVWIPSVDYSDPRLRAAVKAEVIALADEFRGVPGMLMWLLGNENNYGLSWSSFEIEALPRGERDAARARHLYAMFGEMIDALKERDPTRPVAIANGDLQYIDLIAEECKNLDVLGTNVYRGISARDLYDVVKEKLGIPVMFTEFGADAWNAREMREDQRAQARYLVGQWQEIYEQSSGKGRAGNAIGGLIFQWSDGWWKYKQEENLDIHDTNASWPNGGYVEDFVEGQNNMNEEWWGICAKGMPDSRGLYQLYPRAAYFALRSAFTLDPYAPGTDVDAIRKHFSQIQPLAAELEARGDKAALALDALSRVRLSGLRLQFETYTTGGERVSTPSSATPQEALPAFQGFDRMESFYASFEATPAPNVRGSLTLNMLGSVPENRIDQLFYEDRGRSRLVQTTQGNYELQGIERLKVYQSTVNWNDPLFDLSAFYRTGHLHWGYEGDFFGIYRDAFYGENLDIYNGEAPVGVEIAGKKMFQGAKVAFGPQLWWGANPAVILKYQRNVGRFATTAIYQEDITRQSLNITTTNAIPSQPTRVLTLQTASNYGPINYEVAGIWGGSNKVGRSFQIAERASDGSYQILQDFIRDGDTFGAKAKLSGAWRRWLWYTQGAVMGLVADAGPTPTVTYTGWNLKDSGSGNQSNVLAGVAYTSGNLQIAPNFLYQKPIVGPVPGDVPGPGRPRNVLDDPFTVLGNRETSGAELLLTWDPTPATWFWAWDNDVREDARMAASLGFMYRHQPTTRDASIGLLEDGSTTFAFPGGPPARDLWDVRARVVSKIGSDLRVVAHLYGGTAQPNSFGDRLVEHYGFDTQVAWRRLNLRTSAKFDDWGPYDYHRDFNLTYPVQLMADISHTLGTPKWFDYTQTRFGMRGTWRSLDQYSPRYAPGYVPGPGGSLVPDPLIPAPNGNEWEIRTYLHFAM
jgi:hypothetical protein